MDYQQCRDRRLAEDPALREAYRKEKASRLGTWAALLRHVFQHHFEGKGDSTALELDPDAEVFEVRLVGLNQEQFEAIARLRHCIADHVLEDTLVPALLRRQ